MGRPRGVKDRAAEDSVAALGAFVKEARENQKCRKCGAMERSAVLEGSGPGLRDLARRPGMTRQELEFAIRDRGWYCRRCARAGGGRPTGSTTGVSNTTGVKKRTLLSDGDREFYMESLGVGAERFVRVPEGWNLKY